MNRNEDKFGIITDENHQFNSLDEAANYTKGLKDKLKRKASMEEFPITTATSKERLKFIEYGISLMTKKNLPFRSIEKIKCSRSVLWLIASGYTYYSILKYLKKNGIKCSSIEAIKKVEKEGLAMVKECIDKVKNSQTPIIGGV